MSCELLIGRTEPCKDSIGGLKAVYFFNEEPTITYYTNDYHSEFIPLMAPQFHDMVFWVDDVVNLYKFELKANEKGGDLSPP